MLWLSGRESIINFKSAKLCLIWCGTRVSFFFFFCPTEFEVMLHGLFMRQNDICGFLVWCMVTYPFDVKVLVFWGTPPLLISPNPRKLRIHEDSQELQAKSNSRTTLLLHVLHKRKLTM